MNLYYPLKILLVITQILYLSYFAFANIYKNIKLSDVDKFPHNIDQNFSLTVSHSDIKNHHLYAVIILQVNCTNTSESQKLFLYPGFSKMLDHRLKETLFHVMYYETRKFNTMIILRFYREAQSCSFLVEYSAMGGENIHIQLPVDIERIYKTDIFLFRPPRLYLSILADDGHQGGLNIDGRGVILCRAMDGFPLVPPTLTLDRKMKVMLKPNIVDNTVLMQVVAARKDHGVVVICKSGSMTKTSIVRVFHHAISVQINPSGLRMFRQGSSIDCVSTGGYPLPTVRWSVTNLNDTTKRYFSIKSSKSVSTLHINPMTPNDTQWLLNCTSINIIPPLDRSGPSLLLNITIGDEAELSYLRAKYRWITAVSFFLVFTVVIVIVVFVLRHHIRRNCSKDSAQSGPKDAAKYSSAPNADTDSAHKSSIKEEVSFV